MLLKRLVKIYSSKLNCIFFRKMSRSGIAAPYVVLFSICKNASYCFLEADIIRKRKNSNINNILLNNSWINNEIKEEIKTTRKLRNELSNPLGSDKISSKSEFITIQAHINKQEQFSINNLTLHPKEICKSGQDKTKCV